MMTVNERRGGEWDDFQTGEKYTGIVLE